MSFDPRHIIKAIEQAFDTEIFSEHEPQFWGFATQEEWDEWHAAGYPVVSK